MLAEDQQNAIDRASALARQFDASLQISLNVFTRTKTWPYIRNEAILIGSTGTVLYTYEKAYPVTGGESAVVIAGSGVVPVAETSYGHVSTVICNDVGYPALVRQAGEKGADILLAPTHEIYAFQASADAAEAAYRAIESGASLVRPAGDGISLMTDPEGRVIASQQYVTSSDGIMLASIPIHGVATIYSRIGDVFAYVCVLSFIVLAGWAFGRRKQVRTAAVPGWAMTTAHRPM